ncbi:restriction endonuclease FokI C-terminal domain-containing protein [Acinetobacter junii]|uniref:restriction endonuclease FokI C-terminal domain-containing protein n=1 Tax=Acinetobacter junii TaxID=40215 RepID=UPI0012FFF922|nr:restriction endonuclease FokI C-terminal domain-containing protein [Acinetobacter junii]
MIRTYGWVQNPSDFSKLKLVVQIFDATSSHYINLKNNLVPNYIFFDDLRANLLAKLNANKVVFSYSELVGSSKDKNGNSPRSRKDAVADGLIQVTVLPQSAATKGKMWTDNWTSDGFLRWALTLNFVEHDRETDLCKITQSGIEFSRSDNSSLDEKECLRKAILSYPPATRVLEILKNNSESVNKFHIGSQLGFVGEKGFTSYSDAVMTKWLISSSNDEQKKIRSDIEGTSDKYARMIATWLEKLDLVEKKSSTIDTKYGTATDFIKFSITGRGIHALNQINGSSKNTKITKYLTWEFLATDGSNKNYLRTRRAHILKSLQQTPSLSSLMSKLKQLGFNESLAVIKNDIQGLINFGIRIELTDSKAILKDLICDFSIPETDLTLEIQDQRIAAKKAQFLENTNINPKYLELLDIAYNGSRNRDFEILTADLFNNVFGVDTILLGGGRKPDAIINDNNFGVIIDTKAYESGYSKNITEEDKMVRYIEDNQYRDTERNSTAWWGDFKDTIPTTEFYFMWVSSKFIGEFHTQLEATNKRTQTNGCSINVEQLLIGADLVLKNQLHTKNFPEYMQNKEINWRDLGLIH